jgi:DNA repair exonuclease SbcCD nuclease subunit
MKNNPDLIITSDWHLREDKPVCRTDDYWSEMWNKVDFISDLQKKYDCPVIHAGDLFHHWKPSPYLLSMSIEHLPINFWTIYGQHDLPQHNLELVHKSGINTLVKAGKIHALEATHFGTFPSEFSKKMTLGGLKNPILIWHVYNYQGKVPWPGCTSPTGRKLLKKYPEYDLIITGDNHKTFTEEYQGRILVNPGSLMRSNADQINHKPSVFLYYASNNTVKQVFLPINEDVISREHIEKAEKRELRIDAFIDKLKDDSQSFLSFEDNVNNLIRSNKDIHKKTIEIINKALDNDK